MNPTLIIKRDKPRKHYELHYQSHVEFWTLEGEKLGQSTVETYPLGDRDTNTGWRHDISGNRWNITFDGANSFYDSNDRCP